jgi:hypothetical protein
MTYISTSGFPQRDRAQTTLTFRATLQSVSHRVGITCALETGGKISPAEAMQRLEVLLHQLELSGEQLGLGRRSPRQDG